MDKYTPEQRLAINIKDSNVLVSAAAGSGKTSVLVERIIGRITDADNPVDVDRLLVMTFTNAAAAEMRERIRDAITERIEAADTTKTDRKALANLERQSILVHNAMITTIHGFCKSVITDHFGELSIDPNFRVADENECKLMMQDALDACLEEAYEREDEGFLKASECFSGGRSDDAIASYVIPIHRFIMADPKPEEFIRKCCANYEFASFEEFAASDLMKGFEAFLAHEIGRMEELLAEAGEIISDNEFLEPYSAAIGAYSTAVRETGEAGESVKSENDPKARNTGSNPNTLYDAVRNKLCRVDAPSFGRVGTKNLDDEQTAAKDRVKKLRDDVKGRIAKLAEMTAFDINTVYEHLSQTGVEIRALADLVLDFGAKYDAIKRDRNVIDFNDMEHMAVKILENPEIAALYREHFEEVYVDEYQDSNMTQERLVNLICRHDPGNVFQVGDVKQSIYRFRQARPDIFLHKYDTYSDEDGAADRRILLNNNFRSRREVVDAVNEVFSKIMKKDLGGIVYDDDAALCYSANCYTQEIPCDGETYDAELVIGVREELSGAEFQANVIAKRIAAMIIEGYMVYDKGAKITRPASFGDFTVLVRSIRQFEPVFRKVFAAYGLPISVSGREGYFDTIEVKTTLAFLSAVDNSLCDIPLATVARSPVGGFSDRDLALISTGDRSKQCLYDRIKSSADDDKAPKELKDKCRRLLDLLDRYKVMSTYSPVHTVVSHFIDNEYGDYVRCMSNSTQRVANLEMLLAKAEDYGKTSFKGLYQFVRYMDQIRKYEIDDGEAGTAGENDNAVRLMTMHASKGLEFPVCFIAGLEKRRNSSDESGQLIWSTGAGFGCDHVDLLRRVRTATLAKLMVRETNRRESIAEEMRIFYVAMTRAREKLIMVACDKEDGLSDTDRSIEECNSYLDMLKAASDDGSFRHIGISYMTEADLVVSRLEDRLEKETAADEMLAIVREHEGTAQSETGKEQNPDSDVAAQIPVYMQHTAFTYPYPPNPDLCAKLSVSDLKHRAIEEKIAAGEELVPEGKELFPETEPDHYIPKFMRQEGETATGGTFYGTAFHRIMELWDYTADNGEIAPADVSEFAARMLSLRRMERQQAEAIREMDVAKFLNCSLADRMRQAARTKRLFREQPFVIGVPEDGETVLVQGIIDAYFVEDDGITIVDYKTDRVTDDEMLINRYRTQLEYYGMALCQITGRPVKALVIYSTCLGHEIVIPPK